jgi:hypothetical protein
METADSLRRCKFIAALTHIHSIEQHQITLVFCTLQGCHG